MEPIVEKVSPGVEDAARPSAGPDRRLLVAIAAPLAPILLDAGLGLGGPLGDLIGFPVYSGLAAIAPWVAGRWRKGVIVVNAALGAVLWVAVWALTGCDFDASPRPGLVAFSFVTFAILALTSGLGAWITGHGRPRRALLAFAVGVALAVPVYLLLMVSSFNLGGPPPIVIECIPTP